MNHINYEVLVRSCVKIFSEICLKKPVPEYIINSTTPVARIYLNDILTTYPDTVPHYINKKIDIILQHELSKKQIISSDKIFRLCANDQVSLYKGDITLINADCIVNCANDIGLGCFVVGHKCIDNVIGSKAGPKLREECRKKLGTDRIKSGYLITTLGWNLPARYVFHVVGPIYNKHKSKYHEAVLMLSYLNCLNKMKEMGLQSIVFPCISTGEYEFPKHEASVVAIRVVKKWIAEANYPAHIIFCVFTDTDKEIYEKNIVEYL